jgi:hypothetical protein
MSVPLCCVPFVILIYWYEKKIVCALLWTKKFLHLISLDVLFRTNLAHIANIFSPRVSLVGLDKLVLNFFVFYF